MEKDNTMNMTRKEAEAKMVAASVPRDINGNYFLLDILEALGLIQFKEEVEQVERTPESVLSKSIARQDTEARVNAKILIAALENKGFKINKLLLTSNDKIKIIEALAKSKISGTAVMMELDRAGFKIVEK